MKKIILSYIVFTLLCLVSCGQKEKGSSDLYNYNSTSFCNNDTIAVEENSNVEDKEMETTLPSSSSSNHNDNDDDNMRHFDPVSEDDMDDNGMSRFMEANDDEGWY